MNSFFLINLIKIEVERGEREEIVLKNCRELRMRVDKSKTWELLMVSRSKGDLRSVNEGLRTLV